MKIKELIAELEKLPEGLEVYVQDEWDGAGGTDASEVSSIEVLTARETNQDNQRKICLISSGGYQLMEPIWL